ncbi:uncharacterized protein LOC134099247 [Sardina pilchardus]|uniref:uncharacterized protein LOC134099247 n=1 Tax=Sardina pilchardus TaxID=27697 RepID=UPI002E15F204
MECSYTDPLTFGKEISLQVTPKNPPQSLPTISILEPNPSGPDVCLAEAFSPKEGGDMAVNEQKKDLSKAVLSIKTKTYYFAAFETGITKCRFGEKDVTKNTKNDPKPTAPAAKQTESPLNCPDNITSSNQMAVAPAPDPKINFMSVLVTGLRIVFAKAVAINVIMTVKVLVM